MRAQQLQSASTYKSDTRQSMEPHLVSARARARAQPKPRTPRITILPREPPPPPEPQSRRDRKAHSARGAPTEHVRLPDLLGGSQSARPSDDKGGVASRDTKLVLSAEEKLAPLYAAPEPEPPAPSLPLQLRLVPSAAGVTVVIEETLTVGRHK